MASRTSAWHDSAARPMSSDQLGPNVGIHRPACDHLCPNGGLMKWREAAAARRGPRADKADGETAVLAKIAEMRGPDRAMGERLHATIKASAQ